jgi:hypothetical protein
MKSDGYLRAVLTVIAAALVYLCIVLTPVPTAFAQTTQRPGQFTGPGEMVIVGFRLPTGETLPVEVRGAVSVNGTVNESGGNVNVAGRVQTEPASQTVQRVVLSGWEDSAAAAKTGTFRSIVSGKDGLPVAPNR